MKVDRVDVSAYTVPTDLPEGDGTIRWNKTTMVLVEAHSGGVSGLGYTYASRAAAELIQETLRDVVVGNDVMDVTGQWLAMVRSVRNIGRPGIASMAISAIDTALWDLKARIVGQPLCLLLGRARDSIPVYGSGGFTTYSIRQLQAQLTGWCHQGIRMVKMKVGAHPEQDVHRVKAARDVIGEECQLFVDANGAYTRKQALRMARDFEKHGVSWFEEPVSSDDLEGLNLLRNRAPSGMDIAAGEYGFDAAYFRKMLAAGAVDVLQADGTRCGGVTGFLDAAALCEAFMTPLSAHTAPSIHAHLCCAASRARHVEYFHDHVRIEQMFFDGVLIPRNGELVPDLSRPGLGIEFKRADAVAYAA